MSYYYEMPDGSRLNQEQYNDYRAKKIDAEIAAERKAQDEAARLVAAVIPFASDSESSALLSARRFQFFDYQQFANDKKISPVQFPRRVIITRPGMPPLEVAHIEVTPERLPAEVLGAPGTLLPIESCEDWKPAKAAYTPEPDFTEAARKHKYQAVVYINLLISSDGKVLRARALNDTRYALDDAAASKVKTWKFRPATCGNRPVNSEMDVEVAFNLF